MPAAGDLRDMVEVQSRTVVRGGFGQATLDWSTDFARFAAVETLAGQELWSVQQTVPEATVRVTMRYDAAVTAMNRLLFGARVLGIAAVLPDKLRVWMILICTEKVGG